MIGRAGIGFALMAALVVPTAVLSNPSTASAASVDDKVPGAMLPMTQPLTGSVNSVKDPWDFYQMPLEAGEQLHLTLDGTEGGKAFAYLLPPGQKLVNPAGAVAMSVFDKYPAQYSQTLRFAAKTAGTYTLVIFGTDSKYSVNWEVTPQGTDDDAPGIPLLPKHSDALDAATDPSDVYAIGLKAGQTVSATFTKPAEADFDLNVFGPNSETVWYTPADKRNIVWPTNALDESAAYGDDTTERLFFQAPADGTYYVQAAAFAGAGEYKLESKILDSGTMTGVNWTPTGTLEQRTPISVTGRLLDTDGSAMGATSVSFERRDRGTAEWKPVETSETAADGTFVFTATPDRNADFRVRYAGIFDEDAPVLSPVGSFDVTAMLGRPYTKPRVKAGSKFTVKGNVGPQRPQNAKQVSLKFQKKIKGKYVTKKTVTPALKKSGSMSAYSFKTSLGKGSWRVVADQKAGTWAKTTSKPRYFSVR